MQIFKLFNKFTRLFFGNVRFHFVNIALHSTPILRFLLTTPLNTCIINIMNEKELQKHDDNL